MVWIYLLLCHLYSSGSEKSVEWMDGYNVQKYKKLNCLGTIWKADVDPLLESPPESFIDVPGVVGRR